MQRDKNDPNTGNPAADDFGDWMVSSYGQLSSEVLENVWDVLKEVGVDAANQKLIWPDDARLPIDESVKRIHWEFADLPTVLIETHLIGWLEQVYEPEEYTQAQMLGSYEAVCQEKGLISLGCFDHCRRKFVEAQKAIKPKDKKGSGKVSKADIAVSKINALYRLRREIKDSGKR